MTIRETLNKQGAAAKAAIVGFIVIVGLVLWVQLSSGKPRNASTAFYTSDDGQTTFVDDFFRAYPFDHDGKPAYRAYMFQTSSGKQFIGYLERYNSAGAKALDALHEQQLTREQLRQAIQDVRSRYTEVKKPNDPNAKWYRAGSAQASRVEAIVSPDGPEDNCFLVFP